MAFFELGMGELEDSPFEIQSEVSSERFRTNYRGETVRVFVLDSCTPVNVSNVAQMDVGWLDRAILVVNDEKEKEWHERSFSLDARVDAVATSSNISVVRTSDLARLVLGAMRYNWNEEAIIAELMRRGVRGTAPPSSTEVGSVYKVWGDKKIMGITGMAAMSLSDGDTIAVKLRDRFHQERIEKPKADKQRRVTFKLGLPRTEVPGNATVYRLTKASFRSVDAEANDS